MADGPSDAGQTVQAVCPGPICCHAYSFSHQNAVLRLGGQLLLRPASAS